MRSEESGVMRETISQGIADAADRLLLRDMQSLSTGPIEAKHGKGFLIHGRSDN